jgi:hypothetical protein
MKTYSIFGAGAAGLYTAWRLLWGTPKNEAGKTKMLAKGDILELYDWGKYDFSKENQGTRAAGARVCTWHYKNDKSKSFLELGGMRYAPWNEKYQAGQLLVTTVINQLKLDGVPLKNYSVPFNISSNTLFYLRTKNMYLNDINSSNPAPYNVANYGAESSPDTGFSIIERLAVDPNAPPKTRSEWCEFYNSGKINVDLGESSVYKKGELLKDIGYWNLMYDQLGSEGFNYTADGNGYTSNIINWNAADAIQSNDEFAPGSEYKTLTTGYSSMFNALFQAITELAEKKGVKFEYHPNTRLHSILEIDGVIHYTTATRREPAKKSGSKTTQAAWLAMPRSSLELVAQATRYTEHKGVDVLNHPKVQLYLESAIMQPSYKVGMFFDTPWWTTAVYSPQLTSYQITDNVLGVLKTNGFPQNYIDAIEKSKTIIETPFASVNDFIKVVETCIRERLTIKQEELLLTAAENNTIGPSITDTPIRQVVYFGDNALDQTAEPVYGLLASYDDEQFVDFWKELELGPDGNKVVPNSDDCQTLEGPRKAAEIMINMLRQQLAALHFGAGADYAVIPKPLETRFMDWSLPPFNAGYHAYAAHYDIGDVQRKIRKPSQLLDEKDANIFIVGETYSNDQAWVEGAYCTAESVLNDFFDMEPIVSNPNYPFICPKTKK